MRPAASTIWSMVSLRRAGANAAASQVLTWAFEGVLPQVDVARVADLAGQRVLGREPASVIRCGVDPVALHAPLADPQYSEPVKA
jgi:hypothetical protein